MGVFKKEQRTTKSVGKDIGASMRRQEYQQKIIRTLEKEKEQRDRESKLLSRIAELKRERPTFFKKLVGKTEAVAGKVRSFRTRASQFKRNVRLSDKPARKVTRRYTKPRRRTVVRRKARPIRRRRTTTRRRPARRTVTRRRTASRQRVSKPSSNIFGGGYKGSFYN